MTGHSQRLQRSGVVLGLFAGYAGLCWWAFTPMMHALHNHWTTANDLDAGYLLLAVVGFVLWQLAVEPMAAWSRNKDVVLRWSAFIGFVLCIAAAGVAAITANKSVTLALLVVGFAPLCVWVFGARMLSTAVHASAILLMATPIWFVLVPQLQTLTSAAVNWLLSRGSWPIYIEGNLIALPQGMLEIAAGCAGLKFLQTALALTLIEGFVARRTWRAMAVIGAASVVLAIVSNWLRVSIITLLALGFDPAHPWVADHNWVGWLLFGVIFGPLFYWLGGVELFPRRAFTETAKPWGLTTTGGRALAALGIAFGSAYALASSAEGELSERIGEAQVAAVRQYCRDGKEGQDIEPTSLAATAANFFGAQLTINCVTSGGYQLSLRGYVRELQELEVINPVNQLVPGLGLLEYRVTSQSRQADSATTNSTAEPALFSTEQGLSIAYGFYASGGWSSNAQDFKLRSLLRPFVPGPVYALVLVQKPGQTDQRSPKRLAEEFNLLASALQRAQ